MKKSLLIFLTLILCLALCACSSTVKATVTDNEGTEIELSAKEIWKIKSENEAKFDSLYKGAEITFVGTVKSVKTYFRESGSNVNFDSISFKEGFTVYLLSGYEEDLLKELSAGDKVEVTSQIDDCFGGYVEVMGLYSNGGGYNADTLMKTELKLIED